MDIKATIDMNFKFKDFDIDNIVERELTDAASDIEKNAKAITPVDTGRLRASITADVKGLEANIGTDVEYAGFVHDGTYKMPARPFLFSAADGILEGLEERIADEIARLL
jgi:HK97 gp10 family phage protein